MMIKSKILILFFSIFFCTQAIADTPDMLKVFDFNSNTSAFELEKYFVSKNQNHIQDEETSSYIIKDCETLSEITFSYIDKKLRICDVKYVSLDTDKTYHNFVEVIKKLSVKFPSPPMYAIIERKSDSTTNLIKKKFSFNDFLKKTDYKNIIESTEHKYEYYALLSKGGVRYFWDKNENMLATLLIEDPHVLWFTFLYPE